MNLIGAIVLLGALCPTNYGHTDKPGSKTGGFLLRPGNGITFRIDELNKPNASFLDNHAIRLDYASYGISLAKKPLQDQLQIGLFVQDQVEGRDKKMGEFIFPILMGVKATSVGALMMAGVSALILKAFLLGKTSLFVFAAIGLYKLFGSQSHQRVETIPTSHSVHPSKYAYPVQSYFSSQPIDYSSIPMGYANYPPSAHGAAELTAQYVVVGAPSENVIQQQHQVNSLN